MESKNLLTLAITLTVGIILAGSLLMPVIADAQKDMGSPITLTNDSSLVLREIEDGDVLKCVRTKTGASSYTDEWTLNDTEITLLSGSALSWNVGLISDAVYMQINSNSNSAAGTYYNMTSATPGVLYFGISSLAEVGDTGTTTFTVADGNITVVNQQGSTLTVPYTWGYVVCNLEDGQYYSAETSGTGICKTADDLILCGAYTTGDFDTMYSYIGGTEKVSNSSYDMDVDITTALHAGTTDILDITVSVNVTDGTDTENFTPYRIFLPYEVSGHATSGAAYSLLGALPILVIIGLVLAGVAAIGFKNRD